MYKFSEAQKEKLIQSRRSVRAAKNHLKEGEEEMVDFPEVGGWAFPWYMIKHKNSSTCSIFSTYDKNEAFITAEGELVINSDDTLGGWTKTRRVFNTSRTIELLQAVRLTFLLKQKPFE